MKRKILFIDTETGGLDCHKHSLLSIGLATWVDGEVRNKQEIFIKHQDYCATAEALRINQINLVEMQSYINAYQPASAIEQLENFIRYSYYYSAADKITVGGHNVNFDLNFLTAFLKQNNCDLYKFFDYHAIDTSAIMQFLIDAGKLPIDINNLTMACDYFNIPIDKKHSALDDAVRTAQVYTCLLKLTGKEFD